MSSLIPNRYSCLSIGARRSDAQARYDALVDGVSLAARSQSARRPGDRPGSVDFAPELDELVLVSDAVVSVVFRLKLSYRTTRAVGSAGQAERAHPAVSGAMTWDSLSRPSTPRRASHRFMIDVFSADADAKTQPFHAKDALPRKRRTSCWSPTSPSFSLPIDGRLKKSGKRAGAVRSDYARPPERLREGSALPT